MTRVEINTGARLHFGLLAHLPQTGRHFGGVGLIIDAPGVRLSAEVASREEVIGPWFLIPRVKKLIAKYRESAPTNQQRSGCRVEIHEFIPPHQGLGSGTQLALAVGKALSVLAGEADLSTVDLAKRMGRGARSALGLHGFEHGGFLVDGGKSDLEDIGALVSRVEFPEDWRVVLISPDEEPGLSGTKEQTAFRKLSGMPESLTNHLCRLILMDLLPAIVERDFNAFSEAVFEYGQHVGTYFAPLQGGSLGSAQM
jgi:beta-RFAP synthase